MRVNRRFLYAGVFLIAVGGVLVGADLGAVDTARLTDLLRLWPLAVIAIGISLVVRQTRFSLPGGMIAAAMPGLLIGGALAVAPRFAGDCGALATVPTVTTRSGSFDGAADISLRGGCGSIRVTATDGNGWQLNAGNTGDRTAAVTSSGRALSIDSTGEGDWGFLGGGRDSWDLTLPTSPIDTLTMTVTASHSQVALPGAHIGTLALTANASDVDVDVSAAVVDALSVVVNLGRMSIDLPANSDLSGSLRVGGGQLIVCSAPRVGLHVTTRGGPKEVTVNGLHQTESDWQSPDYGSAAHHADLTISANLGGVEINPIGGCR
jgi:hypothetical protein